MRLLPIIMLTLIALPPNAGPIVFLEDGLECSRIHTERAVLGEESVYGSNFFDGDGNYYTIQAMQTGMLKQAPSMIIRHNESGEEKAFAVLKLPKGRSGFFEALTFDKNGDMIISVVSWKQRAPRHTRDFYVVKGMPEPLIWKMMSNSHHFLNAGISVLILVAFAFFVGMVARRFLSLGRTS